MLNCQFSVSVPTLLIESGCVACWPVSTEPKSSALLLIEILACFCTGAGCTLIVTGISLLPTEDCRWIVVAYVPTLTDEVSQVMETICVVVLG
jgi:hypothetical protein